MDAFLAVAAKREVRRYRDEPLPPDAVERVLQAGRVTGSAMNRQPRRFVVVEDERARRGVAESVYAPDNVRGAALVVAIVVRGGATAGFDAGRAAQSMMIAALDDGIGSCPNGIADSERAGGILPLADDERVAIVLTFGYPAGSYRPESRTAEEWIERADRLPLDEVVSRV